MRVLFATSELFPLVKTGGLGDVACSLPSALLDIGVDVRVVLPAYRSVLNAVTQLEIIGWLTLCDGRDVRILTAQHPDLKFPLLLVDAPQLFDRPGQPYTDDDGDNWADNAQRFALFSESAALLSIDKLETGWHADVVHANDWQTGMVAAFLQMQENAPHTLFTVHNIAYDCQLDYATFRSMKLPERWWSIEYGEFYDRLSMLKLGLVLSDSVTTVSPGYAKEIQTPEFGYGYANILSNRADRLFGVLNGIDDQTWNPDTDSHLVAHYNADGSIRAAKQANRIAFLEALGANKTAIKRDVPLVGTVGRLVYQKGVDLLLEVILSLIDKSDAMFAVLGSGERELEQQLQELASRYPERVFCHIGYSEVLAHRLEAGCDVFAMPSRYEPCGLNQMYSLRYGTPPIVHATGGLADTVVDTTPRTLARKEANGFVFGQPTADALQDALLRAFDLYKKRKQWMKLMKIGMRGDYSWHLSARHYMRLYGIE